MRERERERERDQFHDCPQSNGTKEAIKVLIIKDKLILFFGTSPLPTPGDSWKTKQLLVEGDGWVTVAQVDTLFEG